jgi:hypothetical protein
MNRQDDAMDAMPEAPEPPGTGAHPWYFVSLLAVAGGLPYFGRQIMGIMVEPVKQDLGLTDLQISLLQGLAFTAFYSLVALPLDYLADRLSRRSLIGIRRAALVDRHSGLRSDAIVRAALPRADQRGDRRSLAGPGGAFAPVRLFHAAAVAPRFCDLPDGAIYRRRRRLGEPSEIGTPVLWFCSPDASYVAGQAIAVDGAQT